MESTDGQAPPGRISVWRLEGNSRRGGIISFLYDARNLATLFLCLQKLDWRLKKEIFLFLNSLYKWHAEINWRVAPELFASSAGVIGGHEDAAGLPVYQRSLRQDKTCAFQLSSKEQKKHHVLHFFEESNNLHKFDRSMFLEISSLPIAMLGVLLTVDLVIWPWFTQTPNPLKCLGTLNQGLKIDVFSTQFDYLFLLHESVHCRWFCTDVSLLCWELGQLFEVRRIIIYEETQELIIRWQIPWPPPEDVVLVLVSPGECCDWLRPVSWLVFTSGKRIRGITRCLCGAGSHYWSSHCGKWRSHGKLN